MAEEEKPDNARMVAGEEKRTFEIKRKKEKVCIVGFAPTWDMAPWKDDSFEFWACNEFYLVKKEGVEVKLDMLFEVHSRNEIETKERDVIRGNHLKWLQENKTIPVLMSEYHTDIPMCISYPKDYIVKKYGTYFTNTISWQIALAIDLGFQEIHLYGINMANDEEYASQRPSVEYFVGLARGMGRKVFIPDQSDLCKSWTLYGFEDEISTILGKRIKHLRDENIARKQSAEAAAQNNLAIMQQSIGMANCAEYILKAFIYPNTNFNEVIKKGSS